MPQSHSAAQQLITVMSPSEVHDEAAEAEGGNGALRQGEHEPVGMNIQIERNCESRA